MTSARIGIQTLLALVLLACSRSVTADSFGNFLDVSWRLPEPQGAPRTACEKDIQDMYTGLRNMTLWAFEMWDASAREPSGALLGDVFHLGNYDECVGEKQPEDGSYGPPRQYCLIKVTMKSIPDQVYPQVFLPNGSAYNKIYSYGNLAIRTRNLAIWAVCAPTSCQPSEVAALLQAHFHNESLKITESTETPRHEFQAELIPKPCQKADETKPMTYGAIGFFLILGALLTTVALATTYHHFIRKHINTKKEKECPTVVKVFSLFNTMKTLRQRDGVSELRVLNGIRAISLVNIIMGHRVGATVSGPVTDRNHLETTLRQFSSTIIANGDLVVDTFLVMSGLLLVYGFMKGRPKGQFPIKLMVLFRYIRLVPPYALVVLFMGYVLPLTGSGPLWHFIVDPESEPCRVNWWTNLLIINNYVNTDGLCMLQSWYLPCDFHFFLVSLGVVWLLRSRPLARPGLVYLALLLVLSILIPGLVTYFLELPATLVFDDQFFNNPRQHRMFRVSYMKSHNRASSYLIGVLTGYFLVKYHHPGKRIISTKMSVYGTAGAVLVLLGVLISRGVLVHFWIRPYNAVEAALYASLHRPIWCLATGLLILCSTLGNVPYVTDFLSCSKFEPIAKLSFGAYLTHMFIQYRDQGLVRAPVHVNPFNIAGKVIGDTVFSLLASLLLYITIEAPVKELVSKLVPTTNRKLSDVGPNSKPDDSTMLKDSDGGELQTDAAQEPGKKNNNPHELRHRVPSRRDVKQNIKDV